METTHGDVAIRRAVPGDHPRVIAVLPEWWGGRDLRAMVPRLFLEHFADTSLVAETEGGLAGFLIGFLSASQPDTGYVHFLGVHPGSRGSGLGRRLYELFFGICRGRGRSRIKACTSPVNRGSIAFHQRLGFSLEPGDAEIDGVPVTRDYNRPGDDKVLFLKLL